MHGLLGEGRGDKFACGMGIFKDRRMSDEEREKKSGRFVERRGENDERFEGRTKRQCVTSNWHG